MEMDFGQLWLTLRMIWDWQMDNIIFINIILSIVIVFFQRRDPKAVWTWLLVLYFLPIVGFLFYLLVGQGMHKERMFRVKEAEDSMKASISNQEAFIKSHSLELAGPLAKDYTDLVIYNLETSGSVYTADNSIEIFTDGEEKFSDLIREMKKATQYIHVQYYIIKNDELFDRIKPVLIERAAAGVKVRILYDGMGGRFMPARVWKELRSHGILVGEFFPPILGRLHLRINYRNHRKIVVIDGKIGYVGGFNIGREYISLDEKFGYWRDTHLKIRGSAVLGLQLRFALDWNYATGENLFLDSRNFIGVDRPMGNCGVQIISSGPDSASRQIRDNYIRLINKARKNIYIQTPYFIPDDAVCSALIIAAKSGIDVRLMIPCKPDHPFVYWATYSYMGDLLKAGGRCFTYENGFIHAKSLTVDGQVACVGTANMDIRSFELNFEVNAVVYDEATVQKLQDAFVQDMKKSKEVTIPEYENRKLWIRLKEQCCRLLSPLL